MRGFAALKPQTVTIAICPRAATPSAIQKGRSTIAIFLPLSKNGTIRKMRTKIAGIIAPAMNGFRP